MSHLQKKLCAPVVFEVVLFTRFLNFFVFHMCLPIKVITGIYTFNLRLLYGDVCVILLFENVIILTFITSQILFRLKKCMTMLLVLSNVVKPFEQPYMYIYSIYIY